MHNTTMCLPCLRLIKGEDKRLRAGHLWIYSNEVNTQVTPLKAYTPGLCATIETAQGKAIASAYVNPNGLICARVYTPQPDVTLTQALIEQRLRTALAWRARCFDKPFYRLCYGESDYLPGVVIDRYGEYCVVQLTTAGADTL